MPSSAARASPSCAVGQHALFQRGLAFVLQRFDRRVARAELRCEIAQARIQLPALAAHAFQGRAQRNDLGALRLQGQGQRMGGIARTACGIARCVAGLGQLAALGVQRLARGFQFGHAADGVFQLRTRLARLLAAVVQDLVQLQQFAIDPVDAVARRFHLALLALQLAGELGHAAMGDVQRALRVLAMLFRGKQLVAEAGQQLVEFGFAFLQRFDLHAQRLDLALAQQGALLGRAGTQHADPAGAHAFAAAGDDRIAVAQLRQQAARFGQILGDMQAREQATDRQRALHFGGKRSGSEGRTVVVRRDQRDPAFAEFAQRFDQRFRRIDQHAFDQLAQRAFDRIFPARFDREFFADAGGRIQPTRFQPGHRRALLLAQRGMLQGFQRGQATACGLGVLADLGQLRLRAALLFLQRADGLLAGFQIGVEAVQRGFLGFVLLLRLFEHQRQRVQVQATAFAGQDFAAAVGFQRLLVQVIDAGALDFAGARGFGRFAAVPFPALLPVGQFRFRVAQGLLLVLVVFLQLRQLRLGFGDRFAQHAQPGFIAADVLAEFGQARSAASSRAFCRRSASSRWCWICCSMRASALPTW